MTLETLYDHPHYYDILFGWDRTIETDFYDQTFERCGIATTEGVLEVACGTGRVAILLAKRGRDVTGLDISAAMLDYMQRSAASAHVAVKAVRADMTDFTTRGVFAAAYNPMSSFRLLHNDASAMAHLRCVAASLRPGGIYVVDMTFEEGASPTAQTTSESWEMTRGAVTVRAENEAVYVNDDGVERVLAWGREAHLRPYTVEAFVDLLRGVNEFACQSWHPESSRATGVSEFPLAPSPRPIAGRAMVVLRRTD